MGQRDYDSDEQLSKREKIYRPIIYVAQVVNLALVIGGIVFVIWTVVRAQTVLSTYVGPIDGDITRGFGIGVIGGLLASLAAFVAFIGIARRSLWGAVLVILFWIAAWWPIGFGASLINRGGYAISAVACALGATLGIVTFLALKSRRTSVPGSSLRPLAQARSSRRLEGPS